MHRQIYEFVGRTHMRLPQFFENCKVLDCGSLDVNGTNKGHFKDCFYMGVDIGPGPNVDYVSMIHEFTTYPDKYFDTVISTDMLEHDLHWHKSLCHMVDLVRSGGLFLMTCAGRGRGEHGTVRSSADSSPLTVKIPGWQDYYRNLEISDIRTILNLESIFVEFEITETYTNNWGTDLQLWGLKR